MYKNKLISIKNNLLFSYDKKFRCDLDLVSKNTILVSKFYKKIDIILNQELSNIYYEELKNKNSHIDKSGALKISNNLVDKKTKYIVKDECTKDIWWSKNSFNKPISEDSYLYNKESVIFSLTNKKKLYVFDGFIFFDPFIKLKIRIISTTSCNNLFIYNMLIKPTENELYNFGNPDYVIYNCGKIPFINDNDSIQFNFKKKEILILGFLSEESIQECILNILNYESYGTKLLQLNSYSYKKKDKLNLLIGLEADILDKGHVTISFDKTCWSQRGLCNIKNECTTNLNDEVKEYIKYGTLINNNKITFPFEYISNIQPVINKQPDNIILLVSDIYGVLPLVSELTKEQAMYYFMNGYTSKNEKATFSACFNEENLIYHPSIYTELFKEKLDKHEPKVWLVNKGWYGGVYNEGKKYEKEFIKKIIDNITTTKFSKKNFNTLDILNLKYIKKYNPKDNWDDKNKYDEVLKKVAILFSKNFLKYNNTNLYKSLINHG